MAPKTLTTRQPSPRVSPRRSPVDDVVSENDVVDSGNRVDLVTCFRAELGWVAIRWCDQRVRQLVFAYGDQHSALAAVDGERKGLWSEVGRLVHRIDEASLPREAASLVERLRAHLAGEEVDYSDVQLAADQSTEFQRRVQQRCREIGWGETCTYGELAALAGRPGAARAVGSVMSRNRFPLIVPCHRVVPAGGRLGGFSAPGGVATKLDLLRREGAAFVGVAGCATS